MPYASRRTPGTARRRALTRSFVRALAGSLVAAVLVGVAASPGYALPPPPPNPSNGQLSGAAAQKKAVQAQVNALAAKLAQAEAKLQAMQAALQIAQEDYNKAVVDLQMAQDTAAKTKAAVTQAGAAVDKAVTAVAAFARSSYIAGSTLDPDTVMFSADGPTQMIQQSAFLDALARNNIGVMKDLQVAKVAKANADSQAKKAVQLMTVAENNAKAAKQMAETAVLDSQAAMQSVQASKASTEKQLAKAQLKLATLQGQRAKFESWQKKKKAEEAAAAAKRAAAAAAAAAAAQAAAGGGGGGYAAPPPAPGGSGWTAAKGRYAASLALRWLGTPYAWGGGTVAGPSRGVSDGGVADMYGDYNKIGFDCSGLALYAWGNAGIGLPHYSGYQYTSGSFHPSLSQLMPGDLLFWGIGRIHHVAIYIGNGQVVQAPQSGDVVKVSPIWLSDYAGATRPGT